MIELPTFRAFVNGCVVGLVFNGLVPPRMTRALFVAARLLVGAGVWLHRGCWPSVIHVAIASVGPLKDGNRVRINERMSVAFRSVLEEEQA